MRAIVTGKRPRQRAEESAAAYREAGGDRRHGHGRDHMDRRGLTPAGPDNTGHKVHTCSPTDATITVYL